MENPFPSEPETPTPNSTPDNHTAPAHSEAEHAPQSVAEPEPVVEVIPSTTTPSEEAHGMEEPSAEGDSEPLAEGSHEEAPAPEPGSIEDFALRSRRARLPVEEEQQAAALLKDILLGGRSEVARAVQIIPTLPWVITVQGTAAAWPDMKPSFRSQLLAGLAKAQGEGAPRVRLSLARGLFKVDQAAAMKLILLTLKVLRDKETGLLSGKGAPLFANVLIGRGKAWALQLPTADLKPAELELFVNAALHGAFHAPQAPITQLSILRWAGALGKLANLPAALDQMISKGVSRWSAKWQSALRKEVQNFPEAWLEVLKPVQEAPAPAVEKEHALLPEDTDSEPKRPELEDEERSEHPPQEDSSSHQNEEDAEDDDDDDDDDEEEDEDEEDEDEKEDDDSRPTRPQRPVYVSKTVPSQGGHGGHQNQQVARRGGLPQNFNLQDSLRQIEQYTQSLRNDLQAAQKQLRLRDDDRRSRKYERPERQVGPIIPGEPSSDELARLNLQLEARNAELTARIQELTLDSEDRAASKGLVTDTPVQDTDTQLRTLLAFKLKDDFEDFKALEEAAKDLVVQQHYRSVLQHVFEILQLEGVNFTPPEAPSA